MMEKNILIGSLLDIYGGLLPEKQRILIDLACNEDLSLSEISEMEGITRQGVHDSIRRGELLLMGYEEKLHMLQRKQERVEMLKELQDTLEGIKDLSGDAVKDPLCSACEKVVRLLQREE